MHHCRSSLDPNHRNLFGCKSCIMQRKATSEDAYLQETMHVSNHTLAWTVSTERYCTLKLDVPLKSKKKGGTVTENLAVLPQQEDV